MVAMWEGEKVREKKQKDIRMDLSNGRALERVNEE